jgi:hypothetical protein
MLVGHRRTAAILRSVPALASACRIRLANAYCKIFTPMDAKTFRKFRTPAVGEKMILEGNVFVERFFLPRESYANWRMRKCLFTEHHLLLPSRGDPLGVRTATLENRWMCTQP